MLVTSQRIPGPPPCCWLWAAMLAEGPSPERDCAACGGQPGLCSRARSTVSGVTSRLGCVTVGLSITTEPRIPQEQAGKDWKEEYEVQNWLGRRTRALQLFHVHSLGLSPLSRSEMKRWMISLAPNRRTKFVSFTSRLVGKRHSMGALHLNQRAPFSA